MGKAGISKLAALKKNLRLKFKLNFSTLKNKLGSYWTKAQDSLKKGGKSADAWFKTVSSKLKLNSTKANAWWKTMQGTLKSGLKLKGASYASWWKAVQLKTKNALMMYAPRVTKLIVRIKSKLVKWSSLKNKLGSWWTKAASTFKQGSLSTGTWWKHVQAKLKLNSVKAAAWGKTMQGTLRSGLLLKGKAYATWWKGVQVKVKAGISKLAVKVKATVKKAKKSISKVGKPLVLRAKGKVTIKKAKKSVFKVGKAKSFKAKGKVTIKKGKKSVSKVGKPLSIRAKGKVTAKKGKKSVSKVGKPLHFEHNGKLATKKDLLAQLKKTTKKAKKSVSKVGKPLHFGANGKLTTKKLKAVKKGPKVNKKNDEIGAKNGIKKMKVNKSIKIRAKKTGKNVKKILSKKLHRGKKPAPKINKKNDEIGAKNGIKKMKGKKTIKMRVKKTGKIVKKSVKKLVKKIKVRVTKKDIKAVQGLNVLKVPMGDYFVRNKGAEDTLIKLAKLRDAYVVQGSKVDTQVGTLVTDAENYAKRLSAAAIRAKLTARKAKKVSLLWERIVDGVKAKPTKHIGHLKMKLRGNKASIWWASMKKKLGAKGKKTASFWASMKKRAHLGIANLNKYYKLKVKIGAKKPVIVGKNGAGRTPKKFLPKKKISAVVHAKGSSCSSYPPQYQKHAKNQEQRP